MATIQRRVKTYGTRKFTDEVTNAPGNEATILANEVDGDLDDIYAAWNAGTDTVNLKDGSVTVPKLEPAIQGPVQGQFPGSVSFAPRMQIVPFSTTADIYANSATSPNFDNTKPTWLTRMNYGGDVFAVYRAAAPGTTFTAQLTVDGVGNVIVPGFVQSKARAGGAYAPAAITGIGPGASFVVPLTAAWNDTGGFFDAGIGGLHTPNFDCWGMVNTVINIAPGNAALGISLSIEWQVGGTGAYVAIAQMITNIENTQITLSVLRPLNANSKLRTYFINGTGVTLSITYATLTLGILGTT